MLTRSKFDTKKVCILKQQLAPRILPLIVTSMLGSLTYLSISYTYSNDSIQIFSESVGVVKMHHVA